MSYESAIYDVDARRRASGPGNVVTEVAEDYLERYPQGYTCQFPRPNWVLPRRSVSAAG